MHRVLSVYAPGTVKACENSGLDQPISFSDAPSGPAINHSKLNALLEQDVNSIAAPATTLFELNSIQASGGLPQPTKRRTNRKMMDSFFIMLVAVTQL